MFSEHGIEKYDTEKKNNKEKKKEKYIKRKNPHTPNSLKALLFHPTMYMLKYFALNSISK